MTCPHRCTQIFSNPNQVLPKAPEHPAPLQPWYGEMGRPMGVVVVVVVGLLTGSMDGAMYHVGRSVHATFHDDAV